jgi:hypothetical protein
MKLNEEEIFIRLAEMEKAKEITILKREEKFVKIKDNVDSRFEYFRYPEKIEEKEIKEIFDFGSVKIDYQVFFSILKKHLDNNMLMNVKGIYFFDNPDDHKKLLEKHPDVGFDYDNHYGWREAAEDGTVIIINVDIIRKKLGRMDYFGVYSEKEKISLLILETLFHELRHAVTNNILIMEDEIPLSEGKEKAVIRYSRKLIKEKILKDNFLII